jgi:hypothetical protein
VTATSQDRNELSPPVSPDLGDSGSDLTVVCAPPYPAPSSPCHLQGPRWAKRRADNHNVGALSLAGWWHQGGAVVAAGADCWALWRCWRLAKRRRVGSHHIVSSEGGLGGQQSVPSPALTTSLACLSTVVGPYVVPICAIQMDIGLDGQTRRNYCFLRTKAKPAGAVSLPVGVVTALIVLSHLEHRGKP